MWQCKLTLTETDNSSWYSLWGGKKPHCIKLTLKLKKISNNIFQINCNNEEIFTYRTVQYIYMAMIICRLHIFILIKKKIKIRKKS